MSDCWDSHERGTRGGRATPGLPLFAAPALHHFYRRDPSVALVGLPHPRVPDRNAMEAILLMPRTGMQWNALNATGICSCSSAHRRFQERRAHLAGALGCGGCRMSNSTTKRLMTWGDTGSKPAL
jgi:hypothetical protein